MKKKNSLEKSLFFLAWPLVISFVVRSLLTLVDILYASFLGPGALAAIGLTLPLEFAMVALTIGLSTSLSSHLGRHLDNPNQVRAYLKGGRKILAFLSPIFVLLGLGLYLLSDHLGLERDVARSFGIYASILLAGTALTRFWSILSDSLLKAHHDTTSAMRAMLIANGLNVFLNTLFLFLCHWGILGLALSTVLGRLAGFLYSLYRAHQIAPAEIETLFSPAPGEEEKVTGKILALSFPASLVYTLLTLESLGVTLFLIQFDHHRAGLAAYAVFYRVFLLALMPLIALTVAGVPFYSRHFARRHWSVLFESYHRSLLAGAAYCLFLLFPLSFWLAPALLEKYLSPSPWLENTLFAFQAIPFLAFFSLPFHLCKPLFEGLGKGAPPLVIALLRYVVFPLPLVFLFQWWTSSAGWNSFQGLILGLGAAAALSSAIYLIWTEKFLAKEWKKVHREKDKRGESIYSSRDIGKKFSKKVMS